MRCYLACIALTRKSKTSYRAQTSPRLVLRGVMMVLCGVVWCCVVLCGVVWFRVVLCDVVLIGVVWCYLACIAFTHKSTTSSRTARTSLGLVLCCVVLCGVVWCHMVLCSVVWCYLVLCGLMRCCLACIALTHKRTTSSRGAHTSLRYQSHNITPSETLS
jgi:hypothetical protein